MIYRTPFLFEKCKEIIYLPDGCQQTTCFPNSYRLKDSACHEENMGKFSYKPMHFLAL